MLRAPHNAFARAVRAPLLVKDLPHLVHRERGLSPRVVILPLLLGRRVAWRGSGGGGGGGGMVSGRRFRDLEARCEGFVVPAPQKN